MKRFIFLFITNVILLLMVGCNTSATAAYTVQHNEVSYTYSDVDTLVGLMEEQNSIKEAAHQMAEAARQLGYEETHEVIQLAKSEHEAANELYLEYKSIYDDLMEHWHQKEKEYPVAAYIWNYLKELGYSDYVCAGIIGNIMTEVGGQTLNIQYWLSSNRYYGMCQWNKAYSEEVWGASLEEQCAFLRDTIKYEIDTFGYVYKKNFDYDSFLELTDCKKVALAFSKCYERNSSATYKIRQKNAVIAYNYFIS